MPTVKRQITDCQTILASSSFQRRCAICEDFAYSKHFGVMSCRACAAFFRRTISLKRKYTCIHSDECLITADKNLRHTCRFCRFQKCVQQGMNVNAISDREPDELRGYSDPLRAILLSQRSTFVNRYSAQLKACGGDHKSVRMGKDNPVFANMITVMSEFPVVIEYLRCSGFDSYGLDATEITELGKATFYSWICFNSVMNTLRNSGHKLNLSYFVDESFVKADEETVRAFVKTQPGILDYDLAARVTLQCCAENLESASKFHRIRIDDFEQSFLFHIFALKTATQLFPKRENLRPELNRLFNELKLHYLRNYDDLPTKMGNLILMLSELHHWSSFLSEYVLTLHLIGYNPVLTKLSDE